MSINLPPWGPCIYCGVLHDRHTAWCPTIKNQYGGIGHKSCKYGCSGLYEVLTGRYFHNGTCLEFSRSGEMANTSDLKSDAEKLPGSSPGTGTILGGPDYDEAMKFKDPEKDKDFRIIELSRRRRILKDYLQEKVDEEDWHGVQDAASDLRDVESELKGLKYGK